MGLGTRFGARGRRRAKAWGEGCGQGRCRGPGAGKGWGFDVARTATERGKCRQARLAPHRRIVHRLARVGQHDAHRLV